MRRSPLLLFLAVAACHAQPQVREAGKGYVHMIVRAHQLDVRLDTERKLEQPLSVKKEDITLKYLPSGKTVPGALLTEGPALLTGSPQELSMAFPREDATRPEKGDGKFAIEVKGLKIDGGDAVTLKVEGVVYDSSNISSLVKATGDALAPAKTTEEKDLFAGFNIAVPSSSGGVQGDFVFNRTLTSVPSQLRGGLADSGIFGLKVKKGSEDGKDPRHFSFGFHFRKTMLMAARTDIDALRSAIAPGSRAAPDEETLEALDRVRARFFRAFLADYGFQIEGDVSDKGLGNVSNMVFDAMPQLATASKTVFGENGNFTFRLMPAGVELGRNLTNPQKQTKEVGSVSRFKTGAELRFYYEDKTGDSLLRRVELTAASTYRRLFLDEIAYDSKEKKEISTAKGDRLWTQVDFKMFVGPPFGGIRPGLKVTYQRGYLPPVWVRTKVFTYGFVFESAE